MGIWIVNTSNQLFIRGSNAETKFAKKKKQLLAKLCSSFCLFCTPHSVFLNNGFRQCSFYGNVAFSILVLSTKSITPVLWKRFSYFRKLSFKISSNCQTKVCQSLKRRAIWKSLVPLFRKSYALKWNLKDKAWNRAT